MLGDEAKRGFVSALVFKQPGFDFTNYLKINLSDYPVGQPISNPSLPHPDSTLVSGKSGTFWWIMQNSREGFTSLAVFNSYGFGRARIVPINLADVGLPEGPVVKFRDGTLVKQGSAIFIISDGLKRPFTSMGAFLGLGFQLSNVIMADVSGYVTGTALGM